MLTLVSQNAHPNCDGIGRRDFMKIGGLGLGAFGLPQLLAARELAAKSSKSVKDTSVVWLWLGGGPTHVETFDPKMSAPIEYRSVTGEVTTSVPGVTIGGQFQKMAAQAEHFAFVRSFAHTNSGHGGGTHFLMTGYDNRMADNGGQPTRPSLGSITSRLRGANHPETGMPTYVRLDNIGADGPAFLGTGYAPFGTNNQAKTNMTLRTSLERVEDRRALLDGFDRFQRDADRTGLMSGLDAFEQQAFNLVLGNATDAFDLKKESKEVVSKYGKGLGEQLLIARRLCESGCGFVTLNYGGWDMHGNINQALKGRVPMLDHAVATFVNDVRERGLNEKILLVITGEFGRTPRINKNAGRDHWAPLSTLALSGGGLKMGQVIGESDSKVTRPLSRPITPQDLMATVFDVLGIDLATQFTNQAGRPVYMVEGGKPISELV
ncbi:MAG: DUF1501 domain-containing protein [Planctomycetia bacterium]|nr:DUF1501 domain-containing protein [Planctomycetia bacterium]